MKHLPLPAAAGDGAFQQIWAQPQWQPYREAWEAANHNYRQSGGNPWAIEAVDFGDDIAEGQRQLWQNRRQSAAVRAIRGAQLDCCPVCGSQTWGSVDHYLPREGFPEFSTLLENLVPACAHCNSAAKGNTYKGDEEPERFIHPYYDEWASGVLWQTRPVGPFEAATFLALPEDDLPVECATIVRFHLRHVLGEQWSLFNERYWGQLPDLLLGPDRGGEGPPDVQLTLQRRLWDSDKLNGSNSWESALLRGIGREPLALDHLLARAVALIV